MIAFSGLKRKENKNLPVDLTAQFSFKGHLKLEVFRQTHRRTWASWEVQNPATSVEPNAKILWLSLSEGTEHF